MIDIDICYEDDNILIIDKPQGLASTFGKTDCILSTIFSKWPELKNIQGYKDNEGGLLNRLDNETGGLLLIAKNNQSFQYYSKLMQENKICKFYYAISNIVNKNISDMGSINLPIYHSNSNNSKMICIDNPKDIKKTRSKAQVSNTEYVILNRNNKYALIDIKITKGIRHQIRVHLSKIGLPIVGDKIYNKYSSTEKNHLLFCYKVTFTQINGKIETVFSKIKIDNFINKYFNTYID